MSEYKEQIPRLGWIPAAVTAANIAVGFAAMLKAAEGRYDFAVYLLVVAILFDMMDGRLARMLGATSVFGKQLDSFCDVLSFGAAPVFLLYQASLHRLGAAGLAAALIYLLAGVYRLARFNIVADPHSKGRRTLGLPIPIGASYVMAAVLMRDQVDPVWTALLTLVLAAAMVSRWQLPELKGFGLVTVTLLVGLCNYLAVVIWPNWYTVGWWNAWNLLILLATRGEDRRHAASVSADT